MTGFLAVISGFALGVAPFLAKAELVMPEAAAAHSTFCLNSSSASPESVFLRRVCSQSVTLPGTFCCSLCAWIGHRVWVFGLTHEVLIRPVLLLLLLSLQFIYLLLSRLALSVVSLFVVRGALWYFPVYLRGGWFFIKCVDTLFVCSTSLCARLRFAWSEDWEWVIHASDEERANFRC